MMQRVYCERCNWWIELEDPLDFDALTAMHADERPGCPGDFEV